MVVCHVSNMEFNLNENHTHRVIPYKHINPNLVHFAEKNVKQTQNRHNLSFYI